MLLQVKDLSPEQRHAAEILLGHAVGETESVSIRTFDASAIGPARLSGERRIQALEALDRTFASVLTPPCDEVGAEEDEAAFMEAMRSVRPGYRPIG